MSALIFLLSLVIVLTFKYGLFLLCAYFLYDLLRALPKDKRIPDKIKILYKGKNLSEDTIFEMRRSKHRLQLLLFIALLLPLLIAGIIIFFPVALEGLAFLGALSEKNLHLILLPLSLFFIALVGAAILHTFGYYRVSSYISVAALCIYPIMFLFPHFFNEHAGFKFQSAMEIHGKMPVNLSQKFTLHPPKFPSELAWSIDGSILAVASDTTHLTTFDSAGHLLNSFESNGNSNMSNILGFINGSSQILFSFEGAGETEAMIDIRDTTTGHILKTISRPPGQRCYGQNSNNYITISPNQNRFAILCGLNVIATYSRGADGDWHLLSTSKISPKLYFSSVQFFPDNRLITVGGDDGYFSIIDSNTGATLREYLAYNEPGIRDIMEGLAVSPKGDMILTGLKGVSISPAATPEAIAWDRSNHAIVSIWNANDGKEVASFADEGEDIWQAAWDPKGRFVAFIESDSLVLWQPLPGKPNFIRIKFSRRRVNRLAISPDGKSLAVTNEDVVTVYNIEDNSDIAH